MNWIRLPPGFSELEAEESGVPGKDQHQKRGRPYAQLVEDGGQRRVALFTINVGGGPPDEESGHREMLTRIHPPGAS